MGATKGGKNQYETMYTVWKKLYLEGKITKVNGPYTEHTHTHVYMCMPFELGVECDKVSC